MSSLASKWRTLRFLLERRDWRGVRERLISNSTRFLGAFDPGDPKYFARYEAAHPPRDGATLLHLLGAQPPLVSVLTPVYNPPERILRECIASVEAQAYPNWELILVNDGSTEPHVRPLLDSLHDRRIRVVHHDRNRGISAATQTALDHAQGEWIALLDNDDELTPDAIAECILASTPQTDWIYSDFVLKQSNGDLASPFFKPDFSPERLMSQMYLNHLQLMRRSAVLSVGGFRPGFDGSQDFDLALRMLDRKTPVVHVPKVLYQWRVTPGSTTERYDAKPYANEAAKRALRSALVRQGLAIAEDGGDGRDKCDINVADGRAPGTFRIDAQVGRLPKGETALIPAQPLVSIIIPFRDGWSVTDKCVSSILARSRYRRFEIVLMDNGSQNDETRRGIERYAKAHDFIRAVRDERPFNHSALNNLGAEHSRGEVLLLLNNDIEIESVDWLERMLVHVQKREVGTVGCMLLYPNRSIQHAGVILGIGGVAGHAYKGHGENHPGYFGSVAAEQTVSAVTGACMMVRKQVYQQAGGLDADTFPTSYNDVDFCLRLSALGYRHVYTGHSKLLHYESYSRGADAKDSLYKAAMQTRWGSALRNDPFFSPNLSRDWEDYRFGV